MLRSDVFLTTTKETSVSIETNQPTHETPERKQRDRRRNVMVALGAFAAVVVAVAVVATVNSGDDIAPAGTFDDPAAVIELYVTAYNSGDIDAVMEVFSEESVMTGHPAAAKKLTGLTQIRHSQVEEDLNYAATENAYSISNVEVDGDTVTWDQLWVNKAGENYCMEGQSAVIKDGKILTWTWPSANRPCP
jgi:hypothetical protein